MIVRNEVIFSKIFHAELYFDNSDKHHNLFQMKLTKEELLSSKKQKLIDKVILILIHSMCNQLSYNGSK